MIGLNIADKPVLRAYSIASPNWHEVFEFYSIKVEDGPLTSKLQRLKEGDRIIFSQELTAEVISFNDGQCVMNFDPGGKELISSLKDFV